MLRTGYLKSFLLFLICLLIFQGCSQNRDELIEFHGNTMGTTYNIKIVVGSNQTVPENFGEEIDLALKNFNQIMSTYIPDSELSKINQAPRDGWLTVSSSLYHLLDMSQQISKKSDGAFDVTVGPLVNLWGFGPTKRERQVPSEAELAEARARVGYQFIQLSSQRRAVNKSADVYIDLSAIAKGYGTDVIAGLLKDRGFTNFMVEIGGELNLQGYNVEDKLWRIGVEKPTLGHEGAVQAISIYNAGVATSGDYRNYMEVDGKRFSHTIDPATGEPISHNLASVTVVAPTGAEADALATAINVMGPEKGMAYAERYNLAIYMIVRNDEGFHSIHSQAFERYLEPK